MEKAKFKLIEIDSKIIQIHSAGFRGGGSIESIRICLRLGSVWQISLQHPKKLTSKSN